jgi:hypothetical protein
LYLSISLRLVRRVSRGKERAVREADMTRQHTSEGFKWMAGGALVGLGLHILAGNLDRAAAQVRHICGSTAGEGVGVLSSAVLAASQATQAYAFDHQGFLLGLLWMLVSFWPLLLVIVGAVLLQDAFTEKVRALPTSNQYFQHNPFKNNAFKNNATGCRFRCPSFDV